MQDKEHSPEITIRLNPGCKKDGIMHISLCHIFNHIIPGKKTSNHAIINFDLNAVEQSVLNFITQRKY